MANAVTVAVRTRPFNARERASGAQNVLEMHNNTTRITAAGGGPKRSHAFAFDFAFWSFDPEEETFASQEDVFNGIGTKILDSAFDGFNNCLFAYGQTGSGKTYTMMGTKDDPGVIPRICHDLFARCDDMAEAQEGWKSHIQVSYLEIYNEKCRCLLNPMAKEVKPREHPVTGPYVEGLTKVIVHSLSDIQNVMEDGNKVRTVACTNMNSTSSRSHAIFAVIFTQITPSGSEKVSKINLVDLAGSERAAKTGATGATLKEGANINRSLVCLGKVISSLADAAEGGGRANHIPFRDSVLTWVLKENLGGNSRTTMLATLSPHGSNYDESLSTLRYADRAKRIKTNAVVNEDPTSRRIRELTEEVAKLKELLSEKPPAPAKVADAEEAVEAEAEAEATTAAAAETTPGETGETAAAAADAEGGEEQAGEAAASVQSTKGGDEGGEGEDDGAEAAAGYEKLTVSERLDLTVQALQQVSKPWEQEEAENESREATRHEELRRLGIQLAVEVDRTMPSLVNLSEDPTMSGCLVYYLKPETYVGCVAEEEASAEGAETRHRITLQGAGVLEDHCVVTVAVASGGDGGDDADAAADAAAAECRLRLLSEGAAVFVNGRAVPAGDEGVVLRPRDRVIVGEGLRHVFRFVHPRASAAAAAEAEAAGDEPVDFEAAVREKYKDDMLRFQEKVLDAVSAQDERQEDRMAEMERRALEAEQKLQALQQQQAEQAQQVQQKAAIPLPSNLAEQPPPPAERSYSAVSAGAAAAATKSAAAAAAAAGGGGGGGGAAAPDLLSSSQHDVDASLFSATRKNVEGLPPQLLRKYKMVLVGGEGVGKTSLARCWEQGDPYFFNKKLPEVAPTAGVDVTGHRLRFDGKGADEDLILEVCDLAGREAYRSALCKLLTPRSMYCLVWRLDAAGEEGELCEADERCLLAWLDAIYAKTPDARIALVGTHKDAMPATACRSPHLLNQVLFKVQTRVEDYLASIAAEETDEAAGDAPPDKAVQPCVVGSFAVSCKTRVCWGGPFQEAKGVKLSALLRHVAASAYDVCLSDAEYPSGLIPGNHLRFCRELEALRAGRKKLLLPIQEYAHLAGDYGITDPSELLDCTRLLHSWGILHLFAPSRPLLDNPYVFLHPLWLVQMGCAVFSAAHLMRTPPSLRLSTAGLFYSAPNAVKADGGYICKGQITSDLLKVVLHRPVNTIRADTFDTPFALHDLEMCVQLLRSMDLVFKAPAALAADGEASSAEGANGHDDGDEVRRQSSLSPLSSLSRQLYACPAAFPHPCPDSLKDTIPYLFQKGLSRMYMFNVFPKELFERLLCRLSRLILLVEADEPEAAARPPPRGAAGQSTDEVFYSTLWSDSAWLGVNDVRAFLFHEDTMVYVNFMPGSDEREKAQLAELSALVHGVLTSLAQDYAGISLTCCQPCIEPGCEHWFDVGILEHVAAEQGVLECEGCSQLRPAAAVLKGGGLYIPPSAVWHALFPCLARTMTGPVVTALLAHLNCEVESDSQNLLETGVSHLMSLDGAPPVAPWLDMLLKVCVP